MCSLDESRARQLRRELSGLQDKLAKEAGNASKASSAAAKAREQAARAKSDSTRRSKLKEAERKERDAVSAQERQARLQADIAKKTKELNQRDQRIADDQAKTTKALHSELRRRERQDRQSVVSGLGAMRAEDVAASAEMTKMFDLFISHATPDKDEVVRPLAEALKTRGADVFYDEWEIRVGDSLREKIDAGLARSRFGVVILSESFLARRQWTERELNGLFALEGEGHPRILPVWHNVTKTQVASYSPVLADRAALKTADYTLDEIADLLVERLEL